MNQPKLSRIRLYPVKSLDPIEVSSATIGSFSLLHDREFALVTEDGQYINGKRTGRVNQLKATYDLDEKSDILQITLSSRNARDSIKPITFELKEGNTSLENYLSNFFDMKVSVIKRENGELMDIPETGSVTIVSEASYTSLFSDNLGDSMEDLRLRFRTNLEVGEVPPYWEDELFKSPGVGVRFRVGEVEMIGLSPRIRCNVPPRNPLTGDTDKSFAKRMMESRSQNLPKGSHLPEHGNFYHLTINTYLPPDQQGKQLQIGDAIQIIDTVDLDSL